MYPNTCFPISLTNQTLNQNLNCLTTTRRSGLVLYQEDCALKCRTTSLLLSATKQKHRRNVVHIKARKAVLKSTAIPIHNS